MSDKTSQRLPHPLPRPIPPRVGGIVQNGLHTLLGLVLLFVVGVNVVNAVSRYILGISPVGADELMVFVVIWAVMIGAILSLSLRSHINVNLLPLYAVGRARHLLHIVHDTAALFACGFAAYASWLFIARLSRLGISSMGLGVPMAVPHAALLVGFGGMAFAGLIMLARDIRAYIRDEPHQDAAP
ncbi:TRAP transporter small permease subunit [Mesorhizobium sp. NBSH29]|uniref:TRAP transporter small permease n=1 Tax=Mesorhizobium sp. NBSH29 TaxID=2654249 RepID=UPI0018969635|nr:TRAP transporter small permease subunit [Mesorhizobium sp. NBSH29]QPC86239.1 TRAP transporter small permease subunit [Mesorhizobium sp. NBSH29]